jgi:hypothetical protein
MQLMIILAYDVQSVSVRVTLLHRVKLQMHESFCTLPPIVQLGKRIKTCMKKPSPYDSVRAHSDRHC